MQGHRGRANAQAATQLMDVRVPGRSSCLCFVRVSSSPISRVAPASPVSPTPAISGVRPRCRSSRESSGRTTRQLRHKGKQHHQQDRSQRDSRRNNKRQHSSNSKGPFVSNPRTISSSTLRRINRSIKCLPRPAMAAAVEVVGAAWMISICSTACR